MEARRRIGRPGRRWMRVAAAVAMTLGLLIVRRLLPTKTERFISAALTLGWISDRTKAHVEEALSTLIRPDEFVGGIVINGPPRHGALNLYVVSVPATEREAARDAFPEYVGTIAYLGQSNAILIDTDYLEQIGERLRFLAGAEIPNPYVRARRNQNGLRQLLMWVLGHEVAHISAGHPPRHFSPASLDKPVNYDRLGMQNEIDADNGLADRLSTALKERRVTDEAMSVFANELMTLVDVELERVLGVSTRQGPSIQFTDPSVPLQIPAGSHPEFFVRAVRILAQLDSSNPSLKMYTDLLARFEARLKPASADAGRLTVDGEPLGARISVAGHGAALPQYRLPAEVWLPAGEFRVQVEADGHEPVTQAVSVRAGVISRLRVALKRAIAQPAPDPFGAKLWLAANAHVGSAQAYYGGEHFTDAAAWELARAREAAPHASLPVFLLAQMRADQADLVEARTLFEKGLELRAVEPAWQRSDEARTVANAMELLAATSVTSADYRDALLTLIESLWAADDDRLASRFLDDLSPSTSKDARVLLNLARIRTDQERFAEATNAARRAIAFDAGAIDARNALVRVFELTGQLSAAERELLKAIASDRTDVSRRLELARFYDRQHAWHKAVAAYTRAITVEPDLSDIWCDIGDANVHLGKLDVAERAYRSPTDDRPPAKCQIGLSRLSLAQRRATEALGRCQKVLTDTVHDDEKFQAAECVGDAESMLGRPGLARSAYQTALVYGPLNAQVRRKLAVALAETGMADASSLQRWLADQIAALP